MKTFLPILFLFMLLSFYTPTNKNQAQVALHFNHLVNNRLLRLGTAQYQNELKQPFTVSKFKYYVGQLRLSNMKGKDYVSNEYYLIDEEEDLSKYIVLNNVPQGEYNQLSFILGVDSLHNCSGAQSGALDPVNGMFWNWNTGYIFLKLEGSSKYCQTPSNIFEYHIGGFTIDNNCIRKIVLPFRSPMTVSAGAKSVIQIHTAVDEVLKHPTDIDFTRLPSVTDHRNATLVADNYADIFSVDTITYAR